MNQDFLAKVGNELTIEGFLLSNGKEQVLVPFPGEHQDLDTRIFKVEIPEDDDELKQIFDQLDTVKLQGPNKIVLRKSQRQLDSRVTWRVFQRDNYTCRYCNITGVPMTYDHVMLWEKGGPNTELNGITACRKCNKTRGNMEFGEWLQDPYYLDRVTDESHLENLNVNNALQTGQIRPIKRKRKR